MRDDSEGAKLILKGVILDYRGAIPGIEQTMGVSALLVLPV